MTIHAYDKFFLSNSMENLGAMFDCGINHCGFEANEFYDFFLMSNVAQKIENGNPKYICGLSGIELTMEVLEKIGLSRKIESYPNFIRTQEYWAGWILTYFQYQTSISFKKIKEYADFQKIISMYNPLHEASEDKFVDTMNLIIAQKEQLNQTNLQRLRKEANLTQKELSQLS